MLFRFIRYLTYEKRASRHTILAYQQDLESFQTFCEKSFELTALEQASHAEIRAWIIQLVEEKNSASTVNRKISSLRAFYKFLVKNELIELDPMVKIRLLKTPKRLPEFVQEQEMDHVLEESLFPQTFEGQRDLLILKMLYYTGMRLSELVGLKTSDIDLYKSEVKVLGKRNKQRIIPILTDLKNNIQVYQKEKEKSFSNLDEIPYFFVTNKGGQVYPMLVYRTVKMYLDLYAQTHKRSPHVLRHTFATHLLNKGADLNAVKDLLGHANLAATQVYTHNTLDKLKAVFDQAHPKA